MRDLLRKGLDAYEGRRESRDEEFAALVSGGLDALSNRRTHLRFLIVMATVNALIWLSVIIFPHEVIYAWIRVTDLESKIGAGVVGIIFGVGLWLTYSILRLRYPDVEDQNLGGEVFASVSYHARANRRFFVWLVSAAAGVINVLAIIITELALSGN